MNLMNALERNLVGLYRFALGSSQRSTASLSDDSKEPAHVHSQAAVHLRDRSSCSELEFDAAQLRSAMLPDWQGNLSAKRDQPGVDKVSGAEFVLIDQTIIS